MAGWLLDNVLGYVGYVKTLLHTKANVGALLCAALQSPGSVSRRALAHSKLKKQKRKKERKRLERRKPVNYLIHLTEVAFGEVEVRMYKFVQTACVRALPSMPGLSTSSGKKKKTHNVFAISHTNIKGAPRSCQPRAYQN